jgi:hypothetical protein
MRKLLCTVAMAASFSLALPALADTIKSPIVGLWKIDGYSVTDAAKKVMKPMGEHPTGYALYTKGGHIIIISMGNDRAAPAAAMPTDAEAGKLFASMIALDGTYKLAGKGKVLVDADEAWNPSVAGKNLARDYKISGKHLTVTFTAKSPMSGQDVLVTVTSERVE